MIRRAIYERGPGVWHAAVGKGDEDFMPIACSDTEGINLPGYTEIREITCMACIVAAKRKRRERTASPR
jgi:hypothetical protein